MAVGYLIGGTGGMVLAFGFALATNVFAYWNSDKLVLRMQNAVPVSRQKSPDLYDMVAGLSDRAGIPVPKIYMIDTDQPNAFATGRDPNNAVVAVSRGLLEQLEYDEVAGVVAHELAHIRSRDTLTMTVTATLAGAISMLAQFGFFFGGRNSNSPLGPFGAIAMLILAPMAAMLVQMAVSRTREYEADKDGAEISGNPMALASALSKISRLAQRVENPAARRTPGMAHMFIINPLTGGRMDNLFATHPDTGNRIAALERMADEMLPMRSQRRVQPRPVSAQRSGVESDRGQWRVPSAGRRNPASRDSTPKGPWG